MFIEYIKLKNFLSFVELDYKFSSTTTLINGINLSDEGQDSNGAGKTVIQSALEKVLLDCTSRKKVRSQDLIRRGESQSTVETCIYCPVREERLKILRILNLKGSDKLEIYINDTPQSFATVNDGNSFIIEWIGISKEDLSNYYIVNKHRWKSFFSSSNTDKLKLISRFSNTQFIEDSEKFAKSKVDELKDLINENKRECASIEGKIQIISEQIDECDEEHFNESVEREVSNFLNLIKAEEDSIKVLELKVRNSYTELEESKEELTQCTNKLTELKEELNGLASKDSIKGKISEISSEIDELLPEKSKLSEKLKEDRDTLNEAEKYIDLIREKLRGVISCPKCGHRFKEHSDINIEEVEAENVEAHELRTEALSEVYKSQRELDEIQSILDSKRKIMDKFLEDESGLLKSHRIVNNKINSVRDEISDWEVEIKRSERSIAENNQKIAEAKSRIDGYRLDIETAKNKVYDDSAKLKLISKLEEQESLLVIAQKKVDKLLDESKNTEEWCIRLKDFRMYVANIGINEIKRHCNEMLYDMKSDMLVSVDGFKVLADGRIKDEITATVIRDGETFDFGSFSNGEQGRLEYAMIIALQRMVNSTNKWGGLHFLMTDEVCEGIDGTGLCLLAKSLKNMNFPILITTHVTNQSVEVNTLTVIKENKISRIML